MRQPACLEVFRAAYQACIFLFCGGGPGIILSMPLASELPAQQQAQHSQILSLSLLSHLGNDNLYLQTVGAGEEHEISNRPLAASLRPSWLDPPALSLPAPSVKCALVVRLASAGSEQMQMRSSHGSPVFTFSSLTCLLTSGDPRPKNTSFSRS